MATLPLSAGELEALREDHEALLPDTCRIWRVIKESELQPDGTFDDGEQETLYTDEPCSLKVITARRERYAVLGEGLVYPVQYRLITRHDVDGVLIGDRVEILTSDDADVIGRLFEVKDIHRTTQISQRRFTLTDIGR